MRTTLTIDDDLMEELRQTARKSGRPFKQVVNETLRRGLMTGEAPARRKTRFRVRAKACGFRAGIDLARLNQLIDELELDRAGALVIRDR